MLERMINTGDVESTLYSPDKVENGVDHKKAIKKMGDKALIVVFKDTEEGPFVITAFITSKLNRYF